MIDAVRSCRSNRLWHLRTARRTPLLLLPLLPLLLLLLLLLLVLMLVLVLVLLLLFDKMAVQLIDSSCLHQMSLHSMLERSMHARPCLNRKALNGAKASMKQIHHMDLQS